MAGAPANPMEGAAAVDRLTALPGDIVMRIMSHLDARHAVQTCLLLRRWHGLWRFLPRVNVDIYEFTKTTYGSSQMQMDDARFKRFVDGLVARRDPDTSIEVFWLRYPVWDSDGVQDEASADAGQWISHALQKKATYVEVDVLRNGISRDHVVFTSTFLRRLGLSNVTLAQGFFSQLKTGCPQLEHLFLFNCIVQDDKISSQSLKILTIDGTEFSSDDLVPISIPSVTSLTLYCPVTRLPLLEDVASIVGASVALTDEIAGFHFSADVPRLLGSLSAVRKLWLTMCREVKMAKIPKWCPKFINLVNLTLGRWCLESNLYALIVFLQNSPILEKLTLKFDEDEHDNESTSEAIVGELKERSFTCEHLEVVDIICFEGDPQIDSLRGLFFASGMTTLEINFILRDPEY